MKTLIGEVKRYGIWFYIRNRKLPLRLHKRNRRAKKEADPDSPEKTPFLQRRPWDAYKRTGMGFLHRHAKASGSERYLAWAERDIAIHTVINAAGDILVTRRVRHSAMVERNPEKQHCYYPADTASVRRTWMFGAPMGMAFFVSMTWLMLVIGYSISLGWGFDMMLWAIPPVAILLPAALPLGSWLGYRMAPKPMWIYRYTDEGRIAPLIYEAEAFVGSFAPSYIKALSAATDYREFGEGENVGGTNVLRAGAFIAGIVGVCAIIWLAFSNDSGGGSAPFIENPAPISTPLVGEEDWQ